MAWEIRNCDCFSEQGLPSVGRESVDVVLADIPYGMTQNKWDKGVFDIDLMWEMLTSIVKPTTPIILFSMQPFTSLLVTSRIDWFRNEYIWVKDKATRMMEVNHCMLPIHENVLVFSEKYPYYYEKIKVKKRGLEAYTRVRRKKERMSDNYNNDTADVIRSSSEDCGRVPTSVVRFSRDHANQGIHPTQKPIKLLRYILRRHCRKGGTMLDFTCGVASSIVAAVSLGINAIGMEVNETYYDLGVRRVKRFESLGRDEFWLLKPKEPDKSHSHRFF